MAKENYSKYEMNGVLKVLPFSHVSLHKSNTKCTKLFFYHYKIINNIAIKHLLLTVIALCMDTFALATPLYCKVYTLEELDVVIKNSSVYTHKYEQRIDVLKQKLRRANNDEERLAVSRDIFAKYKPFKLDSAYVYAERKLSLAKKLNVYEDSVYSELDIAGIFTKSGNYLEANRILSALDVSLMSNDMRQYYYGLYGELYDALRQTAITSIQREYYERRRLLYRDSLKNLNVLNTDWDKAEFLVTNQKYTDALHILLASYKKLTVDDREMGYVAYSISNIYRQINDKDKEKQYLIISAMSDLKNSIKEYVSLRRLATLLYEEGDVTRAYLYMRKSMEDATFCNAKLRIIEVSDALPIIDNAYDAMRKSERAHITLGLIIVSFLLLLVGALMIYTRKQLRRIAQARRALEESNKSLNEMNQKLNSLNTQLTSTNDKLNEANTALQETNSSLFESNKIKNIYIMEFMNKCSAYIDKLDAYRRSLNKLAANGGLQELYRRLKSSSIVEDEIEEFFEDFDRIFLRIFPEFVVSFNGLMKEDENIQPKKVGRLNTELRIYALLRLGIVENEKIAAFLRCSKQTVYSYRSRIRLRSLYPEDFEERVAKID